MEKDKPNTAVIIAVIGALATVLTACMAGLFGLLQISVPRILEREAGPPAATATMSASPSTVQGAAATATTAPSPTPLLPTQTPTATIEPTPTPAHGLLFASRIDATGRAIDPGVRFPADIAELYAVFPPGNAPLGTTINAENPDDGAYYAFLKAGPESNLASIGWRWVLDGETVQEFEMPVAPGDEFWLSAFNYNPGGLFSGGEPGPGTYRVIITLGGNPAMSSELIIEN